MGAEHLVPTVIFIHDLLYRSSRKSTSGTPRPLRIAQRQEFPSEFKAFYCSPASLKFIPFGAFDKNTLVHIRTSHVPRIVYLVNLTVLLFE